MMLVSAQAGDADTNGAVAGALLGCKLGYNRLPDTWLNDLFHKDWLDERLRRYGALYLALTPHVARS